VVSADPNSKSVTEFMNALLNVKQCNTLIHMKDSYQYYTYDKTDKEKQQSKELGERAFYPQLKVMIQYPWKYHGEQEEFFNGKSELSGVVLLEKGESICIKKEGEFVQDVKLGQLMLEGVENKNAYNADYFLGWNAAKNFINLNQYLTANGLRAVDRDEGNPREAHKYFGLFNVEPAPEGVKTILRVGVAQ
jgi:hypothetical protein